MRLLLLCLAAMAGAAVAVASVAAPRAALPGAACGKLLPPASGAYFGAMGGSEDATSALGIEGLARATGRRMAFATFAIAWGKALEFPTARIEAFWRAGYVPLLRIYTFPIPDNIGPPLSPNSFPGPVPMSAIAAGAFDAELRAFARRARDVDIPLLIDIDPEMNNAHPWGGRYDGGGAGGYGDPSWPDGPEHFRDGYRRIVSIFRDEGATDVTFFFHADTVFGYQAGSYTEPFEQLRWYYPGDDYVDWIGLSVYPNAIMPDGSNATFEEKLATFHAPDYGGTYAEITSLGSRPLALNELGLYSPPSLLTGQAKARWVEDASAAIQSGRYPRIHAVNWWAAVGVTSPWLGDPRQSPELLAGFKAAFDQPFFDAKPQFGGDCSPLAPAKVTLDRGRLSWPAVPNASSYEVWRGRLRIARTEQTSLTVGRAHGPYRVRGVDLVGYGPFTSQ